MNPILDRNNPLSLSRLIDDPRFDAAVENLTERHPDLAALTERNLKKEIRRISGQTVDADDSMLRMKFWFEYDVSMAEGRGMRIVNICAGVMNQNYFWDYIAKPTKLVWLLCPLPAYQQLLDESVATGMQKMRDILELDPVCPITGKFNTALISAQAKIVAMLDMRKNGAYTQTINQRQVQIHASASDVAKEIQNLSMEEVEKRMKKLEAQERDSLRIEQKAKRPVYVSADVTDE